MIFAFLEDGGIEVHADITSAVREYEGIDVESEVVHFYDERGIYLQPIFTSPNRTGRFLGLFSWVASGVITLVANPNADHDSFALALHEATTLGPNPWYGSIEALKSSLAATGVVVDFVTTPRTN